MPSTWIARTCGLVLTGAALALVLGCSDDREHASEAHDGTPPTVTATTPPDGATDVPQVTQITATFSEAMRPSSISADTFQVVVAGGPAWPGWVTYDEQSHVATFAPMAPLPERKPVTAIITTGVMDQWGNHMAAEYRWSFATRAAPDSTPPTVASTDPADGETGVAVNQVVTVTFSEPMKIATMGPTYLSLTANGGTPVPAAVTYIERTASIRPADPLPPNTEITATVRAAVQDLAGNPMGADYTWRFVTGDQPDLTPPTVVATQPADGADDVPRNQTISATFSEAMDPATLTTATLQSFVVIGPNTTPVAGTVTYDPANFIATFTAGELLDANTTYRARVTTAATDLAGNGLATDHEWAFRTGTRIVQPPIDLGSAASFAILAGTAVNSTGETVLHGNLGVSPRATINGFPPGVVNGSTHAGDGVANQAKIDLTVAWLDGAGRTLGAAPLPHELDGLTLTPGLYTYKTAIVLGESKAEAVLTLDAQGDPDAVWIFQAGTTLTSGTGAHVRLVNGAKAENVFWQVGETATFNAGTRWKGTVMALEAITLYPDVQVDGRMLTQLTAVTCERATITVPVVR